MRLADLSNSAFKRKTKRSKSNLQLKNNYFERSFKAGLLSSTREITIYEVFSCPKNLDSFAS